MTSRKIMHVAYVLSAHEGLAVAAFHVASLPGPCAVARQLYAGGATVSITPDGPVAPAGQRHLRIARKVRSPIMATALVIEARNGGRRGNLNSALRWPSFRSKNFGSNHMLMKAKQGLPAAGNAGWSALRCTKRVVTARSR